MKRESSEIEKINAEIAENFAKTLEGRFDSTYAKAFEIYGEMSFNRAFDNDEVKNRLYKEMTLMEKDRGAFLGNPNFCENFISRVESDIESARNILKNYNEQKNEQKSPREKLSGVYDEITKTIKDIEPKMNDKVYIEEKENLKIDLEDLQTCKDAIMNLLNQEEGRLSKPQFEKTIENTVDTAKRHLKATKEHLSKYESSYQEALEKINEQKLASNIELNTQNPIPISSTSPNELTPQDISEGMTYKCSLKNAFREIIKPFKACMNLPQKQPKNQS